MKRGILMEFKKRSHKIISLLLAVITTLSCLTTGAITVHADEFATITIANSLNWENIYIYTWTNDPITSPNGGWPGERLSKSYTNEYGEDVYVATVPADIDGFVISGGGYNGIDNFEISADINEISDGVYWSSGETNQIGQYIFTNDERPPAERNFTVTNTLNWDEMYICTYQRGGSFSESDLPGTKLTDKTINENGEEVYSLTLSTDVAGFVLNDGHGTYSHSVSVLRDGINYWCDGSVDVDDNYIFTFKNRNSEYKYIEIVNTLGWDNMCVYTYDNDEESLMPNGEWNGTKITNKYYNDYGEEAFGAQIYDGADGVIFSDGRDLSSFRIENIVNGATYWSDGSKEPYGRYIFTCNERPLRDRHFSIVNSLGWDEMYICTYKRGGSFTENDLPGTKLTEKTVRENGDEVYSVTIPGDVVDFVINDGNGTRSHSVSIIRDGESYWCDGSVDIDDNYIFTFKRPYIGNKTIQIVNSLGWDNMCVYSYVEGSDMLMPSGDWNGTKITDKYINKYGEEVYVAQVYAAADGMIFSNGRNISSAPIESIVNVATYWTDGSRDSYGSYIFNYEERPIDPNFIPYLIGDVNLDGTVAITDVTKIQLLLAQLIDSLTDLQKTLADVDGDGQITIDDATDIQFFLAFFDHYSSTGESFDGARIPGY